MSILAYHYLISETGNSFFALDGLSDYPKVILIYESQGLYLPWLSLFIDISLEEHLEVFVFGDLSAQPSVYDSNIFC